MAQPSWNHMKELQMVILSVRTVIQQILNIRFSPSDTKRGNKAPEPQFETFALKINK